MDDREIQQWDKRLADQVKRGWDNYKHLHIDLGVARLDQSYLIAGEYLYVEESSSTDAIAKIRLNRINNDELDLEKGVKIETVFIEIFITNDALEGEWLDLVFGINFKYKKKIIEAEAESYLGYIKVTDTKAQNTNGGTFTAGAQRTRDLNTEDTDTNNDCSLAGNQITLAAGTYECSISSPAYKVSRHQLRLYNTTGAAVVLIGTVAYASDVVAMQARSFIVGRFTIAASQALEVQHRCSITRATDGFGVAANFTSEVYTIAEFRRVS